jgi:hypothetical protein
LTLSRSRARVAAASVSALMALACSVPPEQPIVIDFFAASRLRDLTALSRFSTVVFEPHENGVVSRFDIEDVTPERRQGDMRVKDVTVRAPVRLPDGRIQDEVIVLRLQKPERPRAAPGTPALYDGWIVTAASASERPASRATPRS